MVGERLTELSCAKWISCIANWSLDQFGTTEHEELKILAEAALGVCYIICMSNYMLQSLMPKPNSMWRSM